MWWLAPAYAGRAFLPLESVSWQVDVTGPVARIEVRETFRNTSDGLVDAVYVMPLAPDAAIDGLHLRIGTRELDGTVKAREAARAAYEQAAAEGRTAALTEQRADNVFTQDVANVPPGASVEVRISVVQTVDLVDGSWTMTLPLASPPRFVPLGSAPVLAALATESPRDVGVRGEVHLTVQAGGGVRELVAAPLPHDVRPDLLGSQARLRLDDLPLDKDLHLTWRTRRQWPTVSLLSTDEHHLVFVEPGTESSIAAAPDWSRCPVSDVVALAVAGDGWAWAARRDGECAGVDVNGVPATARRAVDPRTVGVSWARARVAELESWGDTGTVEALGLEYGLVTSRTSLVVVDGAGPVNVAPPAPAQLFPVFALDESPPSSVRTVYDFEGIDVAGELVKPEGSYAVSRQFEAEVVQVTTNAPGIAMGPTRDGQPGDPPGDEGAELTLAGRAPTNPAPGASFDAAVWGPLRRGLATIRAEGGGSRFDAGGPVEMARAAATGWGERGRVTGTVDADLAYGDSAAGSWGDVGLDVDVGGSGRTEPGVGSGLRRLSLADEHADRAVGRVGLRGYVRTHTLRFQADGGRWTQVGDERAARWVSGVSFRDDVDQAKARGAFGLAAVQAGPEWGLAPTFDASVGGRVRFGVRSIRSLDGERVAPGGELPSRWDSAARLQIGDRDHLYAEGAVLQERAVFVADPRLDPLPDVGDVVLRTVPSLAAGFAVAGDWSARGGFVWRPIPAELVAGDDPLAPFVPGWLDVSRPWSADAAVAWRRSSGRWDGSIGLSGRHAAAIEPGSSSWWLRAATTFGARGEVGVDASWGNVHLTAGVERSVDDLAASPLPAEVLVTSPLDLGSFGPWRATAGLRIGR